MSLNNCQGRRSFLTACLTTDHHMNIFGLLASPHLCTASSIPAQSCPCTASSLHCLVPAQSCPCATLSLHCLVPALPRPCTASSLHSLVPALPCPCTASSLHCLAPAGDLRQKVSAYQRGYLGIFWGTKLVNSLCNNLFLMAGRKGGKIILWLTTKKMRGKKCSQKMKSTRVCNWG